MNQANNGWWLAIASLFLLSISSFAPGTMRGLARSQLFTTQYGQVVSTGSMHTPRAAHTATLLPDGQILMAGGIERDGSFLSSVELFDAQAGEFIEAGDMTEARASHTANLLQDGRVLIVGGVNRRYLASAEIYNPLDHTFTPTGAMQGQRSGHTATVLADGRVLIIGGYGGDYGASAEIYDPATGEFTPAGTMPEARTGHTATLLEDGQVLIVGGGREDKNSVTPSALLYDPATQQFSPAGTLLHSRYKHGAIGLVDGRVLIVGGADQSDWRGQYRSAEFYDPNTQQFEAAGDMAQSRFKISDTVVALHNGRILVAGGSPSVEIFDPASGFMTVAGAVDAPRYFMTATRLLDGSVLIAGGYDPDIRTTAQAWLYLPEKTPR